MGLLPGIVFYHCHQKKKNSRQFSTVPLGLLPLIYAILIGQIFFLFLYSFILSFLAVRNILNIQVVNGHIHILLAFILPISRDLPVPRMNLRKFPKPRSGCKVFSILHEVFKMAISLFSVIEPWFDVIFPIPISVEGQGGLSKGSH